MTKQEFLQIIKSRRAFTAEESQALRVYGPDGPAFDCPSVVETEEQMVQLNVGLGYGVNVRSHYGTYIGTQTRLQGKTALYYYRDENSVCAQFDDQVLPEAHGWHVFEAKEFAKMK